MLNINGVEYEYKNKKKTNRVLKGINCSFKRGQVYAITGPSGSGKSTLLSMLSGLDNPTKGSVIYDGKDLREWDMDEYRSKEIALIYQSFNLFPLCTVVENITYPLELLGVKKELAQGEAKKYLQLVGIHEDLYDRFPNNLSGGEQQRVAIARGLAKQSKIILADEPTGNLDDENTDNVVGVLTALAHNENYCVIIVTHDMDIANKADVILKLKDGHLK